MEQPLPLDGEAIGEAAPVIPPPDHTAQLLHGDVFEALAGIAPESVQTCITSPPYYGLRTYGIEPRAWTDGLECVLGEEPSLDAYLRHLVEVFREVRRVLRPDGTLWLNLGDCYAGGGKHVEPVKYASIDETKPVRARERSLTGKDLLMVPARAALALQADGWILRQDIIWAKGLSFCEGYSGSVMPESTRDRPTWAHEHVFLLTREERYLYDIEAAREAYAASSKEEAGQGYSGRGRKAYREAGAQNPSDVKRRVLRSIAAGSGRNLRNVWVIPKQNFPGAHFATFPEALVRPMIRLGTSEMGECRECGEAYRRVVHRTPVPASVQADFDASREASAAATGRTDGHTTRRPNHIREVTGESWVKGCGHLDVQPQIVMDPFCGSGRTGVVAVQEGRSFIGIDVNGEYIQMAAQAISAAMEARDGGAGGRGVGGEGGASGRSDHSVGRVDPDHESGGGARPETPRGEVI